MRRTQAGHGLQRAMSAQLQPMMNGLMRLAIPEQLAHSQVWLH